MQRGPPPNFWNKVNKFGFNKLRAMDGRRILQLKKPFKGSRLSCYLGGTEDKKVFSLGGQINDFHLSGISDCLCQISMELWINPV